jgi:hypothetical protein
MNGTTLEQRGSGRATRPHEAERVAWGARQRRRARRRAGAVEHTRYDVGGKGDLDDAHAAAALSADGDVDG